MRPLGPEPRRGKAKCARTFHSESTLLRCLPLLFPNVCCASVREPSQISALGSGTQEVGSQNLRNNQKRKQAKTCSRFWSRRRDLNPRPLGPEPRRGKAKCARTFHSESTLLRCLPLLFPNVCCASVREPSQISALGSGTQEVGSQNLRNNQKRKQAKTCSRFWSRRRDLRLWRRAPVNSAPRCSVCAPSCNFQTPRANRSLTLAPPPSNPVDCRSATKKTAAKHGDSLFGRGDGI